LLSHQDYLFLISTVLVTLIVTPVFIQKKEIIYIVIRKWIKRFLPFVDTFITQRFDQNLSPLDDLHIKNHIVICGYGRIGNYIGKTLLMSNIPFVAIDYNFSIVEKTKKEGVTIIYGDPSDIDILDYAQVDEARILILAIPERMAQEQIVINAKKLNKNIIIISRIHKQHDHHRMKSLGVDVLVQPEFEASLSIIKKILLWYQLPRVEIIQKIKRLKDEYGLV
jgi:CPA2 family monovalent cation:H+ antiporter-2